MRIKSKFLVLLVASAISVVLAACNPTKNRPHFAAPAEQAEVIAAQEDQIREKEVTITAPVTRLLPDDTKGAQHQRLLIGLANGSTVLIAHNIDEAEKVPVTVGDTITIHGVYIWNEKGGVIHWTHHSTSRHEGGYIEFQGKRYE